MKHILFILLALFSVSCVTQKACDRKFPPQVITVVKDSVVMKDSIVYKVIEKEISIKPDTVVKTVTVYVDKNTGLVNSKPVYAETEFAKAMAKVTNSNLELELQQKDTAITITTLAMEAYYWKEKYYKEASKEVVEKKFIPKFYKVMTVVGIILTVIILAWLIYRFRGLLNLSWPR